MCIFASEVSILIRICICYHSSTYMDMLRPPAKAVRRSEMWLSLPAVRGEPDCFCSL